MTATPVTQLWASIADLDEMGPPIEALASKPIPHKLRALRAASGKLLTYVRSRYKPPLVASITEVTTGVYAALEASYTDDELDLSDLATGSIEVSGDPTEALSLAVRTTEAGSPAGLAVAWSYDGGWTWATRDLGTLDGSGAIAFEELGITVTFSGDIEEGAAIFVRAGVEEEIAQEVVSVAAYGLVYNRGVDPNSPEGRTLRQRYEDAIAWAKDVQSEAAKLDEARDATPHKRETGPRGGGQKNAWDWLDDC